VLAGVGVGVLFGFGDDCGEAVICGVAVGAALGLGLTDGVGEDCGAGDVLGAGELLGAMLGAGVGAAAPAANDGIRPLMVNTSAAATAVRMCLILIEEECCDIQ